MSNANTKITYIDGHADELTVTMFHRCRAESHAAKMKWGGGMDSAIRQNLYASYICVRQRNLTKLDFDAWAATVESVTDITTDEPAEGKPSTAGTPADTAN